MGRIGDKINATKQRTMIALGQSRKYRATIDGRNGKMYFHQEWMFKPDDHAPHPITGEDIEGATNMVVLANHEDFRLKEGKRIEFRSLIKGVTFVGKLLGYSYNNFQIELSKDTRLETRSWSAGDIMTFTIEMCADVKLWDPKTEPTKKPVERKARVVKEKGPFKQPTEAQKEIKWDCCPRNRSQVRIVFANTVDQHGALNLLRYNDSIHLDYGARRVNTHIGSVSARTLREWVQLAVELKPNRKVVENS